MRVIAGKKKGRKLIAPVGRNTRPTTDRVKESIFNIIQAYLPANKVLDLFCGSGALAIESLSRGSGTAVFVDNARTSLAAVAANLGKTDFTDCAKTFAVDAINFLDTTQEQFDLIFADPPYNRGFLHKTLDIISRRHLLTTDGIIVVESEADGESTEHPSFVCTKRAVYGNTVISVLKEGQV